MPRHFSLKYVSIPAKKGLAQRKKSLAAGHIMSFQIHPSKNTLTVLPEMLYCIWVMNNGIEL